jgi:hypothetical protein
MKNITEKTAYQQLLEKLDDQDFARQFREEKQQEIEELIAQILMVTTGASVVNGTCEEWGNENLFKIFDILKIRHKNFYIPDLLEELQHYLFVWTNKHSKAYREWSSALESDGDTAETQEKPNVQNTPGESTELENLAAQISEVLRNPNLPVELYNAILHGTDDIINTSSSDVIEKYDTSPEHIKTVLELRSGGVQND